jgi:hypothetical protein
MGHWYWLLLHSFAGKGAGHRLGQGVAPILVLQALQWWQVGTALAKLSKQRGICMV